MELEVGLYHGYLGSDHRSLGVVKLVMGLHYGSPRVVKLVMELYQRCSVRHEEVFQGGGIYSGPSPWKSLGN